MNNNNFDLKIKEYISNVLKYEKFGRYGNILMKMENKHLLESDLISKKANK